VKWQVFAELESPMSARPYSPDKRTFLTSTAAAGASGLFAAKAHAATGTPGITDIVVVTDPAEIRTISKDSRFDREFIARGPIGNIPRVRKMLRVWSLNGRLFPFILPRTNTSRAAAQDALWLRLNVKADEVRLAVHS
jgi:hypothetical protein